MLKISHFIFLNVTLLISCVVYAQTPSSNLMPDGSRDMYIGLGVIHRPIYEGATKTKIAPLPVLQVQWSNGIFIGGMSLGMHLSEQPQIEFGPILTLAQGRTESGIANHLDAINGVTVKHNETSNLSKNTTNKLTGLDVLQNRILLGGFFNYQLSEKFQNTNILTYGSGNQRNGVRLISDLRYRFNDINPHHSITLSMGATFANQAYNQAYFGITPAESERVHRSAYKSASGIKDIHTDLYWNWVFNSSYMLTTKMNMNYIMGSAGKSPLVEQRSNVTVSSALAYRF